MIAIIEPTYALHDHAAVNAALIQAVVLAFPDEDMLFASTAVHRHHVGQFRTLPAAMIAIDIPVPPPGGVSLHRFAAQWRAVRAIMRDHRPRAIVLLSSGPETFFVARAIVAAFGKVRLFVVLHGNLNDAVARRSRDPRRRPFDYRSGLRAARHSRIRLVVLEDYIRSAAIRLGLASSQAMLTWPHPINEEEACTDPAAAIGEPPRLAFIGAATRRKGFDKFLALVKGTTGYAFRFIGAQIEVFPEAASIIDVPDKPLARKDFIRQLREIDYVVLPFMGNSHELTASGTLLDCVAQAKPVISLDVAGVREMTDRFGDIGFICGSMAEMQSLLSSPHLLSDPTAYRNFQDHLAAICTSRTSAGIAPLVRRDIGS